VAIIALFDPQAKPELGGFWNGSSRSPSSSASPASRPWSGSSRPASGGLS